MGPSRGSFSFAKGLERLWNEGTLTGLGTGALLERYLASGDEGAFEALVARHGPMVLGLCRRMLSDPRDVEDAFQAVFMVLARNAGRVRNPNRLSSWLYGVAYKVAARARNQAARTRARETPLTEIEDPRNGSTSLLDQIGPALDQELSRLPEKYRSPLLLCYFRGRTHDQAAQELACPVGTVRSRLARGRDMLRKRLVERGCAPAVALLDEAPIRWACEAVTTALAGRTARAAVQFGWSKTVPAAAAAAAALSQGVLTSMKLASLKMAALTIVAAGLSLSAGGLAAGRWMGAAPTQEPAALAKPQPKPQAKATPPKTAVEQPGVQPAGADPELEDKALNADIATFRKIREAEAKLKIAVRSFKAVREVGLRGQALEEERAKGILAMADLQGYVDAYRAQAQRIKKEIAGWTQDLAKIRETRERLAALVKQENRWSGDVETIIEKVETEPSRMGRFKEKEALLKTESPKKSLENMIETFRPQQERYEECERWVKQMLTIGAPLEEPDPPVQPGQGIHPL